jgi:hypothetical protein
MDDESFSDTTKPSSVLKWKCGACSKLGPRNSNEDRFVAIDDLFHGIIAFLLQVFLKKIIIISF